MFMVCGYLWYVTVDGCCLQTWRAHNSTLCRQLSVYPRGRKDFAGKVALYLKCIGSPPEQAVYWLIQNQDDEEKTVSTGSIMTPKWPGLDCLHAHQPRFKACANADMNRVFAPNGWGKSDMLSSEVLFDIKKGFVKKQELVLGVHISAVAAVGSLRLLAIFTFCLSFHIQCVCRIPISSRGALRFLASLCQMCLSHILMMLPQMTSL